MITVELYQQTFTQCKKIMLQTKARRRGRSSHPLSMMILTSNSYTKIQATCSWIFWDRIYLLFHNVTAPVYAGVEDVSWLIPK